MDKLNSISFPKQGKGGSSKKFMNIVTHLPSDLSNLQYNLAQVHAKAIINQINRLDCPYEQKLQIIKTFLSEVQRKKIG